TSVTLVAKEASVARPGSVSAEAVVIMRGSQDVTGSYAVETVDGILTLTPLTLTQENTAVITDTLTFTGAEQSLTASDVVARVTLGNGTVETLAVGQRTLSGITGTKVGIYTLTITGKANFQGSVTAQWRIAPRLEDVTALTADTVKTTDRAALEDFTRSVAPDQMVGVQVPPPAWAAAAEDCYALLEKLDQVEARLEELEALAEDPVTAQNVELADKERLEQELSSFEEALEDYATAPADNLTEEQKDWIEDQIRRLEEALAVVEEAQEVVDLVERLPDTTDPEDDVNDDAIHAAKERYDALSGNGKKLVDRETDGKLAQLYDALTNYKIVKGNGSGWIRYSEGGLSFTANGAFSKFTGVKVDGKVLDPENYTAEEGSTVVTLKESWLDRQRNGKHTIQLTYTDGATGIGSFRIVTDSGNPFTGDMIMVAVAVMAVSGAVLVVLLLLKKRK
ncbi:MAG: hypothetical protein IJA71_07590, partial [Clostridia bacterium]|nr:hypothetical protein [Clostridia bacterium]